MVGPSGFVERYKGKFTADPSATRVAGIPMYGAATQQIGTPVSTNSTVNIGMVTVARINASSTAAFVRLPSISFIGQPLAVEIYGGSTKTWVTCAAGQTFAGSSYNTLYSTVNAVFELNATSSNNWGIVGTFSTAAYTLVLSTST